MFYLNELTSETSYKATLKGDIFQLKLLMAVAVTAHSNALSFVLNTEVRETDKFDDLVVEYENSATVLQAKHSSKPDNYNKNDFKAKRKGEASLAKYFDSFVRISETDRTFGEKTVNYIFFTNRGLEHDSFFETLAEVEELDKNLKFETVASKCWQFSEDFKAKVDGFEGIYQELCQAIKENSQVYYKLLSNDLCIDASEHQESLSLEAERLTTKISQDVCALYKADDTADSYTVDLTSKGGFTNSRNLLISMLQYHGEQNHTAYSNEFINGENLKNFQIEFRQNLLNKLCKKLEIKENECLHILSKTIFKFPKNIAQHVWMPRNGQNEVVVEVEENDGNTKLTWKPTESQAYYVVGMFGEFEFTYQPEIDFPLSDLTVVNQLHVAILAALKNVQNVNVNEVEKTFSEYLDAFFAAFTIKTGQPNEEELEEILQSKLHSSLMFSGDEYYSQLLEKFLNWLKDFRGKPIKKDTLDEFFKQVRAGIQRLHLTGYSEHVLKTLDEHPSELFLETHLNPLKTFIKNKDARHVLLLTGSDALSLTLAASQVVKSLKEELLLTEDNWGFVSPDCRILDKVPSALSHRYALMIIDHADKLLSQQELLLEIISAVIKNKKKLILICQDKKIPMLNKLFENEPERHFLPELTDEEVEKACKDHKDKHVFVCGRKVKLGDVIINKVGGIYRAMHSASWLSCVLKLSSTNGVYDSAQKNPVYTHKKSRNIQLIII